MKECGESNPLSISERAHYEAQLKAKYVIGGQLGRSGQSTSAYLLTDEKGEHYALKIPNEIETCLRQSRLPCILLTARLVHLWTLRYRDKHQYL